MLLLFFYLFHIQLHVIVAMIQITPWVPPPDQQEAKSSLLLQTLLLIFGYH